MDSVRRRARREAGLVAAAMALLYLLTVTSNHTEAEDAMLYAPGITEGDIGTVLHPHHLLWGALAWVSHNAARALGHDGDAMAVVQAQNALIGAAGIGFLWWWLRSTRWSLSACVLACGMLGFSYGYWFYSGEFEVYVLSASLLIACIAAAHRAVLAPSPGRFALLGAVNGVAVLAHDTNVLFAGVTLAALILSRGGAPLGELVRRGAAYAAVAVVVVLPAYAAAALANGHESPRQAYDWIGQYAQSGEWGHLTSSSVPEGVVGSGRTLVGGHFVFSVEAIADWIGGLGGRNPREERFMMRDYPDALGLGLLVLLAIVVASLIVLAVGTWRARRSFDDSQRALGVMCACWAFAWGLFFVWWEPINVEFWIVWWIPVSLLVSIHLADSTRPPPRPSRVAVPALVGALALVNLVGSVLPAGSDDDDYWRTRTQWYAREATPRDLAVVFSFEQFTYADYLSPATPLDVEEVLSAHDGDLRAAAAATLASISQWRGGRVLVSRELIDPAGDPWSNCQGGEQCAMARILRPSVLPHARVVHRDEAETVYELRPP